MNEGNLEQAKAAYALAAKEIDKAVSKGVFHKNNGARKNPA